MAYNKKENKPENSSILLLGRFGFDGDKLEKSGLFEYDTYSRKISSVKYPNLNITFMTAHASKGLGYDNVIVVNGRNETYGFPSKIEDDPVLALVIKGDRSIDYAEERRLFYVAMTRTKNRVYFIAPEQNPSEFLLEIKRDYKNVVLRGDWSEEPPEIKFKKKTCPVCGYPMQFRYKNAYGLRLHICTNEPEICGFMTNEPKAGKLPIMKCDKCRDGYLIIKPGKNDGYFLGCTNYSSNGKGCNNVVSSEEYYRENNISPLIAPKKEFPKAANIKPKNIAVSNYSKEANKSDEGIKQSNNTYFSNSNYNSKLDIIEYNNISLNKVLITILQCLMHINEQNYYGKNILVDVLRGANSQKITERKLDIISEYGKLHYVRREDLMCIVDWMIDNHYILQTKAKYPVLHLTYDGMHYTEKVTVRQLNKLKNILEQ